MFKKLLAGLLAVVMIGCAGIGIKEALVQNNGCPYPKLYKYENATIMVADEDYYMWNGMQLLLQDETNGFSFIIMDYDVSGVVFGFDEDGDCEADRCIGIAVTDLEDVKNAIDVDDISVTWAGALDCDQITEFIESNLE
jgi:hypothetical protein